MTMCKNCHFGISKGLIERCILPIKSHIYIINVGTNKNINSQLFGLSFDPALEKLACLEFNTLKVFARNLSTL